MFQSKFVEKTKTHIWCSITSFSESRKVYEIMWKNMVESNRPQMIMRPMRFACWITRTTDTLIIFNTYYFSTTTMVKRTRLNVTLYVHCLSCSIYFLPKGYIILSIHSFDRPVNKHVYSFSWLFVATWHSFNELLTSITVSYDPN